MAFVSSSADAFLAESRASVRARVRFTAPVYAPMGALSEHFIAVALGDCVSVGVQSMTPLVPMLATAQEGGNSLTGRTGLPRQSRRIDSPSSSM